MTATSPERAAVPPAVLDTGQGLARMLGDYQVYGNVLRRFDTYTTFVHDAATQLAEGDLGTALRTLHTLRGAAGLVGAPELYALATQAEEALAQGRDIAALFEPLQAAVLRLQAEITSELGRNPPPQSMQAIAPSEGIDPDTIVQELAGLLDEGNGTAVDMAQRHGPLLQAKLGATAWRRIAEAVDGYDFDYALTLLRQSS